MHHFVVKFPKFSSPQNPEDVPDCAESKIVTVILAPLYCRRSGCVWRGTRSIYDRSPQVRHGRNSVTAPVAACFQHLSFRLLIIVPPPGRRRSIGPFPYSSSSSSSGGVSNEAVEWPVRVDDVILNLFAARRNPLRACPLFHVRSSVHQSNGENQEGPESLASAQGA